MSASRRPAALALFSVFAVLAQLSLSACIRARHDGPELVGQWTTGTIAPDGVHGTKATYDLKDDGTFEMSGYPPIEVRGRWRVTERSPGKLRLKLTDQQMTVPGRSSTRWNDEEAWGALSKDGRTFTFNAKVWSKNQPKR